MPDKCIKRICGWVGTDDEKRKVRNRKLSDADFTVNDLVCPNCGCRTFTEVPEKPAKKPVGLKQKQLGFIDWDIAVVILLLVALLVSMIYFGKKDVEEWNKFVQSHNCKIVSKIDGDIISTTSIDSRGNPSVGIGVTPDKTGWQCDDGVTYYR